MAVTDPDRRRTIQGLQAGDILFRRSAFGRAASEAYRAYSYSTGPPGYGVLVSASPVGAVVTELPPFLGVEPIRGGQLLPVLGEYPMPEQQVSLLYPAHRHPSSIVRAYLNFCQKQLPRFLEITQQ